MSDPRFARLKTDPRFRRPKKYKNKVTVDERFKDIFEDKKTNKTKKDKGGRIDKYGRAVSDRVERDDLRQFYRLEDGKDDLAAVVPAAPDYARGEVVLESSDEEDLAHAEDSEEEDGVVALGFDQSKPIPVPQDDDTVEVDLDENDFAELDAQAAVYSKAQPQQEGPTLSERTRRIAVVNLDWDHVRAGHLYRVFSSLVSPSGVALSTKPVHDATGKEEAAATVVRGQVLSVRIYPSEFGKERMAREEKEGPPPEIFKKRGVQDDEEVNERNIYELGDEDEYDDDALRKYQLERLRYYYALVTCDTVDAASHIYSELEGTELERSANVFDLSFVPDDMTFDEEFRDEATGDVEDASYKGLDFVTDALRHSKVKLTWDEDDPERHRITRRTLTKQEIAEGNFRAFVASSGSESESDAPPPHEQNKKGARRKDKDKDKAKRDKLRALLLGGDDNDALPEGWGRDDDANGGDDDVDMEITFRPGLSEQKDGEGETTLEAYQRKMREKRKKRKEEAKNNSKKEAPKAAAGSADDFFAGASDEDEDDNEASADKAPVPPRKHKRDNSTGEATDTTPRHISTTGELALLAASDNPHHEPNHFDLKVVVKAEKAKKGKRRRGKKRAEADGEAEALQEGFQIDVRDERFKALHEDHTFAIDPTNPHFTKTRSMDALLQERAKRKRERADGSRVKGGETGPVVVSDRSLQSLVDSVKRKSVREEQQERDSEKRRKI